MNPAQRAKRLQAHNLRCQGLTYRQIGERMRCAHSTAARYVRDFEANRAEITESLAADLLVHSVANLQTPDPDLHAQHINAARELRLLVNSLDQVEDRRQKRARRVAMEEEADALKNIQALEDLVVTMHENGIDDMTPYLTDHGALSTEHVTQPPLSPRAAEQDPAHNLLSPRAAGGATVHSVFSPRAAGGATVHSAFSPRAAGGATVHSASSPRAAGGATVHSASSPRAAGGATVHSASSPRAADGSLPRTRCGDAEGRGGSPAFSTPTIAAPTPTNLVQPQPRSAHQPTKSAQNRPKSNNTDQDLPQSPAKHAKSRPNARKQQLSGPQFTTPEPLPKPGNRRYLGTDPTVRRLFGDWTRP